MVFGEIRNEKIGSSFGVFASQSFAEISIPLDSVGFGRQIKIEANLYHCPRFGKSICVIDDFIGIIQRKKDKTDPAKKSEIYNEKGRMVLHFDVHDVDASFSKIKDGNQFAWQGPKV